MSRVGEQILQHLETVRVERAVRALDQTLDERVTHVKRFQQARFALTYADLLSHPRYAGAARFFLEDLYGPGDFTQRDAHFARVVPALVRLFPHEFAHTVESLTALHALSERLDSEMAHRVPGLPLTRAGYIVAWQETGQPLIRQRQINLMLEVGRALDIYTQRPLLRHSLRTMRLPARAAGLANLQTFLENGFDTFRAMRGASEFLKQIEQRERDMAARLFGSGPAPDLPE